MAVRVRCRSLCAFFVFVLATGTTAQTTWYVDAAASPPGTGTQSAPYASIQHAISAASTVNGDMVSIAAGTYLERIDLLGKAITLQGAGGAQATIIDGQQLGSTVKIVSGEGQGTVLRSLTIRNGLGTPHSWFVAGGGVLCIASSPRFIDVTVTGNRAKQGAGVYLSDSDAEFDSCRIESNLWYAYETGGLGGGVCVSGGDPIFTSCLIANNRSDIGNGGGVAGGGRYYGCTITGNRAYEGAGGFGGEYYNCTITNNVTVTPEYCSGRGGGVSGGVLVDCVVANNTARVQGGGIYASTATNCDIYGNSVGSCEWIQGSGGGTGSSTLLNCRIYGNTATGNNQPPWENLSGGGGIAGGTATGCEIRDNLTVRGHGGGAITATLMDCTVFRNEAREPTSPSNPSRGGGLSGCTAVRCLIYDNMAVAGGGASDGMLDNCVLIRNSATNGTGGFNAHLGGSLRNCILWGDQGNEVGSTVPFGSGGPGVSGVVTLAYCDVQSSAPGVGNLQVDPRFWDATANNFRLMPGSPCVDAGDPASPLDSDGSRADIGAFPFDPNYCPVCLTYCTAKQNSLGCAPQIGSVGVPSLSGNPSYVIRASNVLNQKLGMLLWSFSPSNNPFGGGTLCVQQPIVRTPAQVSGGSTVGSDCTGQYSFHFSSVYMVQQLLAANTTIHAQYWSRDPGFAAPNNIGLTNGLTFTIVP